MVKFINWVLIRQRQLESHARNSLDSIENIWIVKKYSGRMSVDYPISDNISCILRHCEGRICRTIFLFILVFALCCKGFAFLLLFVP